MAGNGSGVEHRRFLRYRLAAPTLVAAATLRSATVEPATAIAAVAA